MIPPDDPRFMAVLDMVRRTGAREVQIRYSDDEEPTVWMVVARYHRGKDGRPKPSGALNAWDAGAGQDPFTAVCRLLDQVVDGGTCTHCLRPTGFSPDADDLPLADHVCWYQYDPSTQKIVKGCAA